MLYIVYINSGYEQDLAVAQVCTTKKEAMFEAQECVKANPEVYPKGVVYLNSEHPDSSRRTYTEHVIVLQASFYQPEIHGSSI